MTQIQNTSLSFAATNGFRVAAREHTLAPPGRHRSRHSRMSLKTCQSTPTIDAAFYYLIGTLYQLQPSFHTSSTEPEPTAHARRAGEEFYSTTPEFMFVFIRLLSVDAIQSASASMSYVRWSLRASPRSDFGTQGLLQRGLDTSTCEYQRRYHPDGP